MASPDPAPPVPSGTPEGGSPPGPEREQSLEDILESLLRQYLNMLSGFARTATTATRWLYRWDPAEQRWKARAVGGMSDEEIARLKEQGYLEYGDARLMATQSNFILPQPEGVLWSQAMEAQALQFAPALQAIGALGRLAETLRPPASGGGGGLFDFLGQLIGLFVPFFPKIGGSPPKAPFRK